MTPCPGCGVVLATVEGPTHAYIGASPACWAVFGEVLAREFVDAERFRVHQLTVDAYAAQHPGEPSRRSARSVGLHLATLHLFLERGHDPAAGPVLHKRLVRSDVWRWLEPPHPLGSLTVAHVRDASSAEEHVDRVWEWARDVWQAWAPHHATVRAWVESAYSPGRR